MTTSRLDAIAAAACLWVAVLAAACDESFEPTAPTDLAFSVFGYLDASADTQWIRIMPIRPLKVTSQEALEATVTLEHLGTGRIVELRDSLSGFSSYYVHNFWTTEDIEPGAAYRFSARREGKEPAEAVVEIPRDYEVEVAIGQADSIDLEWWGWWVSYLPDSLWVSGVKYLPFVATIKHFHDDCGPDVTRTVYQRSLADDGAHRIWIETPPIFRPPDCGSLVVEDSVLWIVGSEVAWPVGEDYSPGGLGGSGRTSNVTNALGFLGGVLSKVIPYEDCKLQGHDYCVLRYNPEMATVSGTVRETRCGDGPIESDTVRVKELDRDLARIRIVYSNRAGEFLIAALEPGIPHVLWSRAPQTPVDSLFNPWCDCYEYTDYADAYTPHTDTLTFTPGQHLEHNINLERLTPCSHPPPGAK